MYHMVLLTVLMHHQKLEVVSGVEDIKAIYQTFGFGIFKVSFSYFEKRWRDNMVTGKGADVTFDKGDCRFVTQ